MLFSRKEKYIARSLATSVVNAVGFIIAFGVAFIICGGKTLYRISRNIRNYFHYKDIKYSYEDIRRRILDMNGFQFEKFCAKLFEQFGHKVKHTPESNDYGRDLILDDDTFVECKHYTGNNFVGREICQKLIGSMEFFYITKGIVITTGQIHDNAYEYASRLTNKSLKFINLDDIMDMINTVDPTKVPLIIESSFEPTQENFTTVFKEIYE